MADITLSRQCSIVAQCCVSYDDKQQAEKDIQKIADNLETNYKNAQKDMPCAEITLMDFVEDAENGNYAVFNVESEYYEDCECYYGCPSYDYYEPDTPDEIESPDEDEKAHEMVDEIEEAFKDLDLDCFNTDIIDNNIETLDSLFDKMQEATEPDYDCYYNEMDL